MHYASVAIFLLLFDVPFESISLVKKRHHCHWRTTEPMTFESIGIYSATTAVNWDFGCCGLIQRTVYIGRFLWQAGGLENHSKPFFHFIYHVFHPIFAWIISSSDKHSDRAHSNRNFVVHVIELQPKKFPSEST